MEVGRNMVNLREKTNISQKIPVRAADMRNLVDKMLDLLSAKQKLVLASRFGIGNGEAKTLEAIGKNLTITRERVRQIETDAIEIIKKKEKSESFAELADLIREIMKERGGVSDKDALTKEVVARFWSKPEATSEEFRMSGILYLVAGLKRLKASREMAEVWTSSDFNKKYFNEVTKELERIFDEAKKLLTTEEILKKIHYGEFAKKHPELVPSHVENFLVVSKKFGKNVFGDWGKSRWPLVRPRGMREKATLVLMKRNKPLHFREISKLIEEYGLSAKKVHPQTVHNELIRDKRFVLVGRGTYALREWGYEEGTVKDVIIALLKSAGGILSKDNIYKSVLKKRKVKKATIAVNLADKKTFEKAGAEYKLKVR